MIIMIKVIDSNWIFFLTLLMGIEYHNYFLVGDIDWDCFIQLRLEYNGNIMVFLRVSTVPNHI